jgi:hypothetical protein
MLTPAEPVFSFASTISPASSGVGADGYEKRADSTPPSSCTVQSRNDDTKTTGIPKQSEDVGSVWTGAQDRCIGTTGYLMDGVFSVFHFGSRARAGSKIVLYDRLQAGSRSNGTLADRVEVLARSIELQVKTLRAEV